MDGVVVDLNATGFDAELSTTVGTACAEALVAADERSVEAWGSEAGSEDEHEDAGEEEGLVGLR